MPDRGCPTFPYTWKGSRLCALVYADVEVVACVIDGHLPGIFPGLARNA